MMTSSQRICECELLILLTTQRRDERKYLVIFPQLLLISSSSSTVKKFLFASRFFFSLFSHPAIFLPSSECEVENCGKSFEVEDGNLCERNLNFSTLDISFLFAAPFPHIHRSLLLLLLLLCERSEPTDDSSQKVQDSSPLSSTSWALKHINVHIVQSSLHRAQFNHKKMYLLIDNAKWELVDFGVESKVSSARVCFPLRGSSTHFTTKYKSFRIYFRFYSRQKNTENLLAWETSIEQRPEKRQNGRRARNEIKVSSHIARTSGSSAWWK